MRKNGTLNYIIGDHLGSTSLVTDATGNVINQTQYKAWGETRYSSGTEQTKYTYTGQYSYTSDFGLHFYNARWYDSSLSRFAQADTIVPGGVQGYDRYAYVNNNPVAYTDPTGHCIDSGTGDVDMGGYPYGTSGLCSGGGASISSFQDKFDEFYTDAERIAKNKGKNDTLEAMARIVEKASSIFGVDLNDMMTALSMVFLGSTEYGSFALVKAEQLAESDGFPKYFLGGYFSDTGFNSAFQDGQNQVYHVWGYIAQTIVLSGNSNDYKTALAIGRLANNRHEIFPDGGGGSREDFLLSVAGMDIGSQISSGKISPSDLGDALRTNLGENASTTGQYLFWQYWILPGAQK